MSRPIILDGLHNSRCGSFHSVGIILDAEKLHGQTHKDFIIFYILGHIKHILELQNHFYRNSRSRGDPCSIIREYNVALKNSGISVA